MFLESVEAENFLSYKKFKMKLEDQGLVLIQGDNRDDPAYDSNGAGKSSSFEAIVHTIYGKTMRGLKGDDVINLDAGKGCMTALNCRDDSGAKYRVERYRKHKTGKNNVFIYRNDENITPKSTKDADKFLAELFSIDFQTFTNSIIFGQGDEIARFSTASDSEKKDILEKILEMTVFKSAQEEAKARLAEKTTAISTNERNTSQALGLIDEYKSALEKLRDAERKNLADIDEQITLMKAQHDLHESESVKLAAQATDYETEAEKVEAKLSEVNEKLSKYKKIQELIDKQNSVVTGSKVEIRHFNSELLSLKDEVTKLKNGEGTNCPACGQEVTAETVKPSIDHTTAKMREIMLKRKATQEHLDKNELLLEGLKKKLAGKDILEQEKNDIVGELSELKASIRVSDEKLRNVESKKKTTLELIERLEKNRDKTYKPLINEKEQQLADKEKHVEELTTQRRELVKEAELIEFWVSAYGNSGVKSYLLDSVTPYLTKRANYYAGKLCGNTVEIIFSTQKQLKSGETRDKFEVQITNTVGGASYLANSTGERRRIDLAISLALQDLVMTRSKGKLNVLLYDEAFDGLDATGCENLIQLLQELSTRVGSIYVITHNDALKAFFDNQITVVKSNGETQLVLS